MASIKFKVKNFTFVIEELYSDREKDRYKVELYFRDNLVFETERLYMTPFYKGIGEVLSTACVFFMSTEINGQIITPSDLLSLEILCGRLESDDDESMYEIFYEVLEGYVENNSEEFYQIESAILDCDDMFIRDIDAAVSDYKWYPTLLQEIIEQII